MHTSADITMAAKLSHNVVYDANANDVKIKMLE